jgi:hypothetical protein
MRDIVAGTFVGQVGRRRRCECCGGVFFAKRGSRRQFFCSDRCRDADRRERNFARFGTARRGRQAVPRTTRNNQVISGACKGDFGDRLLTEIAFSTLSPPAFGSARAKAAAIAEYSRHHPVPGPLIGPNDPPVNIVGGYKFPGAPKIDLNPTVAVLNPTPAPGVDNEIIPEFLRRVPGSSS